LYSPEGTTYLALAMPHQLKITNFSHTLSFSALVQGDPVGIYGKALRFLKLVFHAADGEELVILACNVLD